MGNACGAQIAAKTTQSDEEGEKCQKLEFWKPNPTQSTPKIKYIPFGRLDGREYSWVGQAKTITNQNGRPLPSMWRGGDKNKSSGLEKEKLYHFFNTQN